MTRKNRKQIIHPGDVYGKLTVIKFLYQMKNKNYLWLCKCDCGKETKVITTNLRKNRVKSCGCLVGESISKLLSKERGFAGFTRLKRGYKKSATKRNLNFDLSDNDLQILFKGNCSYCGTEPKQIRKGSKNNGDHSDYIYNGIDRIDNKLGYLKDNVVSCCKICNKMKLQLGLDEFMNHINKIRQYHRKYYGTKP
jgi:hypothetical protein